MASGRRKRLAKIIRTEILDPAGLTRIPEANRGAQAGTITTTALYQSGGFSPTFTEGSQTILGDTVSNTDYLWSLLGYTGETAAQADGFVPSNVKHRYLPLAGEATPAAYTDSTPVVLYSKDGPQGRFNQQFVPTANQVNNTGSIIFNTQISGAADGLSKLRVYVAGAFPTSSVGAVFTVLTGTVTPLITYTSSSAADPNVLTASFPAVFPSGINSATSGPPVANDVLKITLPAGFADITSNTDYTITIKASLTPAATGNNLFIKNDVTVLAAESLHKVIQDGINGSALATSSSIGTGFQTLSNYLTAVSGANGVDLFTKQVGSYGSLIAVSGSNNKIKKIAGVQKFVFNPFFVAASFETASMGAITMSYSSSADTATLNSFAPGLLVYITGSNF